MAVYIFAFACLISFLSAEEPVSSLSSKAKQASLEQAQAEASDGWISLFDGKTLEGWTRHDGKATYEVRDGTIVGRSSLLTPNSFLCTDQTFGDFILEFEVKCGPINSGVQIRSREKRPNGRTRVNGPQVEIEHSPGQSGYIYGEASGGWLSPEPKSEASTVREHEVFKNDVWNSYRIIAKGPTIKTFINGQAITELTMTEEYYREYAEGLIGLQVHAHPIPGVEIQWRNIRIREL